MGFLFSGIFWGIVLIVLGVTVILNMALHIHIPIFRVLLALLLVYLGVIVISGGFKPKQVKSDVIFSDATVTGVNDSKEMNVIFGRGVLDLTDPATFKPGRVEYNVIFSGGVININKNLPVRIRLDSAFAGARMPDGNIVSFGNSDFLTPSFKDEKEGLVIHANVVFGGLEINLK